MILWCSCRSSFLKKAIRRIVQGSVVQTEIMGTTFTRSCNISPGQTVRACTNDTCGSQTAGKITRLESESNYVEQVVCNQDDLNDNEMKVFDIGEDGKVLLVKQKGEFSALGTKCTHYGAPLVSGALGDGRLRCQWHGACFNIKTGDIEDFPGFDSLPCYNVTVTEKGEVKVRAKISDLKSNKRIKDMGSGAACEGASVVVVGGGPSGATCVEALRGAGFRGAVTLVAREPHLPYDRIKLSKLGAATDISTLQARTPEYYRGTSITVLKGVSAIKVEPTQRLVHLSDGSHLKYTYLYLATGSKPRVPEIEGINLKNVFTVRDFQDSVDILNTLGSAQDKHVVVLGLSFIGLETASTCCKKAKSMTVVGKNKAPLEQVFGMEIGQSLQKLFEGNGVQFQFNTTIVKCNGENGVIKSVELANGQTLPADMLILGVGTTFYTDFLRDTGIDMQPNGAVTVNDKLETNLKNIYAGGDIAYAPVHSYGNQQMSIGHVGLAQYHGRVAALNILKKDTPLRTVPYFWTTIFGKSIRYAGCGQPSSTLVDGDIAALKFVIFFFNNAEKVIAVASCMRDPVVSQFAEFLHQGKSLYKKDLKDDRFAWTRNIN